MEQALNLRLDDGVAIYFGRSRLVVPCFLALAAAGFLLAGLTLAIQEPNKAWACMLFSSAMALLCLGIAGWQLRAYRRHRPGSNTPWLLLNAQGVSIQGSPALPWSAVSQVAKLDIWQGRNILYRLQLALTPAGENAVSSLHWWQKFLAPDTSQNMNQTLRIPVDQLDRGPYEVCLLALRCHHGLIAKASPDLPMRVIQVNQYQLAQTALAARKSPDKDSGT